MQRACSESLAPLRRLCTSWSGPSTAAAQAANQWGPASERSLQTGSDALISLHTFQPVSASLFSPAAGRQQTAAHSAAALQELKISEARQQSRGFAAKPAAGKPQRSTSGRGLMPAAPPPLQKGVVHVQGSRNNTILTLTDEEGNTQAWASAGCMGFKNARKATSYAAEAAAEKLAGDAMRLGFKSVQLRIKGLGQGKIASVKMLHSSGLTITKITECTPLPHNGCRPPKKRRV